MKKCTNQISIKNGVGNILDFQCQSELNHKGVHKHYGDNYCITWVKEEHMIPFPEEVTDELRERCRKLLQVDALETAGDSISDLI